MKTIFSFFLVLGMVLFLTGCLGDDGEGGITTAGTDQESSSSLVVTSSSLADDGLSSGSEEPESSASGSSSSSVTDVSSSSVQIVSSVVLTRNLDKNGKANKVYITKQGMTLWQKKTNREERNVAA